MRQWGQTKQAKGQVARRRTGCGQEQAGMNLEQRLEPQYWAVH